MTSRNSIIFLPPGGGQLVFVPDYRPLLVSMPKAAAKQVEPLVGSVILLARAGGGVGADTVASLLRIQLESLNCRVAFIDFNEIDEEGPGWSNSDSETCAYEKCEINADLATALGDLFDRYSDRTIIINSPQGKLLDFCLAEEHLRNFLGDVHRPYFIFWIDGVNDAHSNKLRDYVDLGGAGKIVILAREPNSLRNPTPVININRPVGVASVVVIPRLGSAMIEAFYTHRKPFEMAFDFAGVGEQAVFSNRYLQFMDQLERATK